jgi:hypothetical protein
MREHAITKMRALLSVEDRETLSALKERERHKCRELSERLTRDQAVARLKGMKPKEVFTKSFWQHVGQLIVHGEIDPSEMKPLFSRDTASALEKLGGVSPALMKPVISGLRGLKKVKAALGDARKKKQHDVFDIQSKSYDVCSKNYAIGSYDYDKCMKQGNRSMYGKNVLTAKIPTNLRDKSEMPVLSHELEKKLAEFGSTKKLAQVLAKFKK